jgi:uncharacterized protein YjbI with pentapeptide repeats
MANDAHVALLKQGVGVWNAWRKATPTLRPNLAGANLAGENLAEANLLSASLDNANLRGANLTDTQFSLASMNDADLRGADLRNAYIFRSFLLSTNLAGANLQGAAFEQSNLRGADLSGADLRQTYLYRTNLTDTNLSRADLRGAHLKEANLYRANLTGAELSNAVLERASFVECNLENANLTGSRVYGISAWGLKLNGANQTDLVISPPSEPEGTFFVPSMDDNGKETIRPLFPSSYPPREQTTSITVDNLEMAQFLYLLLYNQRLGEVIDSITSKTVLILGRFTPARKRVLDAIRDELRLHNYLPILFDFAPPATRDFTETITTLAGLARFIVADLTEPSSVAKELEAIVPKLAVPVQPLLEASAQTYSMFQDYWKYPWMLEVHRYDDVEELIASLEEKVIAPAEEKIRSLKSQRSSAG